MTVYRLAFLNTDAVRALEWIRNHYQKMEEEGSVYKPLVSLVHIGFPTPIATRSSDETLKPHMLRTVHDKPDFMVQARSALPATLRQWFLCYY
jgi:hypothetical protein